MRKILITIIVSIGFVSCAQWENEYDFKNYLRDKHPYSEITKTNLGKWTYQVNDTIKKEIWIYNTGIEKHTVIGHCVNCRDFGE